MRSLAAALLALASVGLMPDGARAQEAALAAIDVEARDGGVTVRGRVVALSGGRFETRMRVEKSGRSGSTDTTQGGTVSLDAGEDSVVATVGVDLSPGDRLAVTFELRAGDGTVSTGALTLGE